MLLPAITSRLPLSPGKSREVPHVRPESPPAGRPAYVPPDPPPPPPAAAGEFVIAHCANPWPAPTPAPPVRRLAAYPPFASAWSDSFRNDSTLSISDPTLTPVQPAHPGLLQPLPHLALQRVAAILQPLQFPRRHNLLDRRPLGFSRRRRRRSTAASAGFGAEIRGGPAGRSMVAGAFTGASSWGGTSSAAGFTGCGGGSSTCVCGIESAGAGVCRPPARSETRAAAPAAGSAPCAAWSETHSR